MQPRGPLMIEHRLIEKMIGLIVKLIQQAESTRRIDPLCIDKAVGFIRTYADKTHHGKEEDILFRDLAEKEMSPRDDRIMKELIEEHIFGRKTVGELVDARNEYVQGNVGAFEVITEKLRAISEFYPPHIEKEDKVFFPASMEYFSEEEKENMLREFREFDQAMIHKKYLEETEEMEEMLSDR